ncbi:HU family DNA-binding protein [uncultured Bacteroides sp.]|uniref:HU family DNA-binding protein n=1 Tax=uncultured Bacteroides sp. TaxID=162156 RepID=UPI002AAB7C8C|nr:HU family DNA-binding protein [uncultured Bacteroides sp.]
MSVNFSVVPKKNPSKTAEPAKFYAQAQGHGEMGFDAICEDVDSRCTAAKADVTAALNGVLTTMKLFLGKGEIIRLGDFGTFQVALSSHGATTEKEFNSSMIRKARISFRPGKLLTNMLKTLEYSQVPKLSVKPPVVVKPEAGV